MKIRKTETEKFLFRRDDKHKHGFQVIVGVLLLTCLIVLTINTLTQFWWVNSELTNNAEKYYFQVESWIEENRMALDMLAHTFYANPNLVNDYDACVKYLDDMVVENEDVSAVYIANAKWKPNIIFNSGWKPKENWNVEERPWYRGSVLSEEKNGFYISASYYDVQTGYYCITMSRQAVDAQGNRIGIVGIDYYMDKLKKVLGESYTEEGYAFLVDKEHNIINHPHDVYEMTTETAVKVDADDLVYRKVFEKDGAVFLRDYDGNYKVCRKVECGEHGFTILVVKNLWSIYGNLLLSNLLILLAFSACIVFIVTIMNRVDRIQQKADRELQAAAESASAASRAKSDFLAQMSHEIRTPINAVLGMNEMILRECEDENVIEYSENIRNAGKTLLNLVNGILDFSKIEEGKMEIVPTEYDTASLINDLVYTIADRAEQKNLLLHVEVNPGLPRTLYGDNMRIWQIISNLLTNAVKYTEKGSVTLKIDYELLLGKGEVLIRVSVQDTGIGIRQEDMEKLFESFKRLELKKNRHIEGTGLGIPIVQRLLQLMDSTLEVNSVYGQGSEFSFAVRQKIVDREPIGDYRERLRRSMQNRKPETHLYAPAASVLVVDDYPLNLKVAKGLLKCCGIVPDVAISGRECIEKVKQKKYDLILMDHMMPEPDGIETLHILKRDVGLPEDTKVIIVTANAVFGAREEYLKEGFDEYLSKPIAFEEMEGLLEQYLPKEKLSFKTEEKEIPDTPVVEESGGEEEKPEAYSDDILDKLEAAVPELRVEEGLLFCADSKSLYLEILRDYAEDLKEKQMEQWLSEENYDDYALAVHTLKNTSKTIGADALSEKFYALQKAAQKKDAAFIREQHPSTMRDYIALKASIQQFWEKD